jgi:hypothetical protein
MSRIVIQGGVSKQGRVNEWMLAGDGDFYYW